MNPYVFSFRNMDGLVSHHVDGILRAIGDSPLTQETRDRHVVMLQVRLLAMLIDEVQAVKVGLKVKELANMQFADLNELRKAQRQGPSYRPSDNQGGSIT